MDKDERQTGYIQKVNEETRRFTQNLLTENEKLRALVASFQSEKGLLEKELLTAQQTIEQHKKEELLIQQQLADIEAENRRFSEQYVQVEQQNSNLANLYVASYRLHGTLDRKEVLSTLQEIIINLIGSEELGIFELNQKKSALSLVASFGIEPEHFQGISLGSGLIGRVAKTGEMYLAGEGNRNGPSGGEANLTACIPLRVGDKIIGVIAIFRLLQQKPGLEAVDRELFDLLATHAGMALYCTGLHTRAGVGVEGAG